MNIEVKFLTQSFQKLQTSIHFFSVYLKLWHIPYNDLTLNCSFSVSKVSFLVFFTLLQFIFLLMTADWSGKWVILAKRTSIKTLKTANNTDHLRILSGCLLGC